MTAGALAPYQQRHLQRVPPYYVGRSRNARVAHRVRHACAYWVYGHFSHIAIDFYCTAIGTVKQTKNPVSYGGQLLGEADRPVCEACLKSAPPLPSGTTRVDITARGGVGAT